MRFHAIPSLSILISFTLILVSSISVPKTKLQSIQNTNILHPLAIQADLLQLNDTITKLIENSTSQNAALLQKATDDAWSAVQNAVKPLIPTSNRRRRLQATLPTTKPQFKIPPEVINAVSNRVRGAIQQAIQNPNATQAFLASLSPALQGITPATPLPSIPLANITQAIKQYVEISNMMDSVFNAATKVLPQGNGATLFPARRRLHSNSNTTVTASAAEKALQRLITFSSKRQNNNALVSSSSNNKHSIADIQETLKRSMDSADRLKNGGIIPSDKVADEIIDRMRGLEDRYKVLQTHLNEPRTVKIRSSRDLKQYSDFDGEESLFDEEDGMYGSDESSLFDEFMDGEYGSDDEDLAWLSNGKRKPVSMHNTVIMMMSSEQAVESTAMLHDMLSFLQQVMDVAHPLDDDDEFYRDDIEDASFYLNDDDNDAYSPRRRHMLAQTTAKNTDNAVDYEYQLEEEDMYYYDEGLDVEDESWLFMNNDDNTEVFERAVIGYHNLSRNGSIPTNKDDMITDLVVSLIAPADKGGIPLALLQILTDPSNTTIADLLQILSSSPGSIHLEASSTSDDTAVKSNLPRFAVFGSSTLPSGMHAAGALPQDARKTREGRNSMTDLILQPLSSAIKGPTVHDVDVGGMPTTMDARWWGVVLSLGFVGLLLVATALSVMSRGSLSGHQLLPTEDTDVSIRAGGIIQQQSSNVGNSYHDRQQQKDRREMKSNGGKQKLRKQSSSSLPA